MREKDASQKLPKMTPKEVEHRKVDLNIGDAEIARRMKAAGHNISASYVSLILSGKRTGYQHRAALAKILKLKVSDLWEPRRTRKRVEAN
jgi:hypothetical protein